MLVTFVSQCEKKALNRTRRVLDAFADRIGDRTWQTIITEEGLLMVKKLLRQSASKSTAVACHWLRGRKCTELVWIVGNRKQFNAEGVVPVNSTRKNVLQSNWENTWKYLPLIKALVALAALFHDWGKANSWFQGKLKKNSRIGDPLRHEWISCLLLNALIVQSGDFNNDKAWLELLMCEGINELNLKKAIENKPKKPLENLPPLASMVAWLVLTHHRLPVINDVKRFDNHERQQIAQILKDIQAEWGYENKYDESEYEKNLNACFNFPYGLLAQSNPWIKQLKKWAQRLLEQQANIEQIMQNGVWRLVLQHARLCLMLGDHYYSSCPKDDPMLWQNSIESHANSDKNGLKQKLDEHLVKVSQHALRISQYLSCFTKEDEMGFANDIKQLKQKSSGAYGWQDNAVEQIKKFRNENQVDRKSHGWFIVNMASTGCGKTIANAKIMRALSHDGDSLRYILALGLRTLTLQTGDEYRVRIGLEKADLAVLIGSAAFKELHEMARNHQKPLSDTMTYEEQGSESAESLLDEEIDFLDKEIPNFLNTIIPPGDSKQAKKNKAFLYAPVLACTIDHIIAATETIRGGKYILPYLRLLSSDLVIDEIDDFNGSDLIAIGRLIHLAGMLGRKVMISSATIPPALAEGFFNAYQAGWMVHSQFHEAPKKIASAWVDEFETKVNFVNVISSKTFCEQYNNIHQQFIKQRVESLRSQPVKRKGKIIRCQELLNLSDFKEREKGYFEIIKQAIIDLHNQHHEVDPVTGKKVSFGVVRIANIPPCVRLAKYLVFAADWSIQHAPKIMAYHSRQVLLLRHTQENHLDEVLKRKNDASPFTNALIRNHLDNNTPDNVIFILVATPVEEIGRDHDFDWAIIEPSSYRSIIQLVGRVMRHRLLLHEIKQPNVAIMQYNLRALRKDGKPVFQRPGYENNKTLRLGSHDLSQLIDEQAITYAINAIPRIEQPEEPLQYAKKLADLEHQAMINDLKNYQGKGPETLQAWLSGCWWMTGFPQRINRFRGMQPDITLYYIWESGKVTFCEKNEHGKFIERTNRYGIKPTELTNIDVSRLWIARDYETSLRQFVNKQAYIINSDFDEESIMHHYSKKYGEITYPIYDQNKHNRNFWYSDQFGLEEI